MITFEFAIVWWKLLLGVLGLAWAAKSAHVWYVAGWRTALMWPIVMLFGGLKP